MGICRALGAMAWARTWPCDVTIVTGWYKAPPVEEKGSWGYQTPKFLPPPRQLPPWSLPGTAGEPLLALMAKLPGGSAAAGTTMPGGGLEAGGSATGELCSISCDKKY